MNIARSPANMAPARHSERMRELALELPTPLRQLKSPFPNAPPEPSPETVAMDDALADYRLVRVLGKGAFGLVTLLRSKESGQLVAVKTFQRSELSPRRQRTIAREIRVLRRLEHRSCAAQLEHGSQDTAGAFA